MCLLWGRGRQKRRQPSLTYDAALGFCGIESERTNGLAYERCFYAGRESRIHPLRPIAGAVRPMHFVYRGVDFRHDDRACRARALPVETGRPVGRTRPYLLDRRPHLRLKGGHVVFLRRSPNGHSPETRQAFPFFTL
jgi:hypothetical protein